MVRIATCNADSSGIELAVFDGVTLKAQDRNEVRTVAQAVAWLQAYDWANMRAIGHRVAHGGRDFAAPVVVTDQNLAALEALTPLAPLHQPHNLEVIRELRAQVPGLPQVAC